MLAVGQGKVGLVSKWSLLQLMVKMSSCLASHLLQWNGNVLVLAMLSFKQQFTRKVDGMYKSILYHKLLPSTCVAAWDTVKDIIHVVTEANNFPVFVSMQGS